MNVQITKLDQKSKDKAREIVAKLTLNANLFGNLGRSFSKILTINPELVSSFSHQHLIIGADHGIHKEEVISNIPYVSNALRAVLFFEDDWKQIWPLLPTSSLLVDCAFDRYWQNTGKTLDHKIARGSKNLIYFSALEDFRCQNAIEKASVMAHKIDAPVVSLSDLSAGNWISFVLINSRLLALDSELAHFLSFYKLENKLINRIKAVFEKKNSIEHPIDLLEQFGGYEIAYMLGLILKLAENKKVILIEGLSAITAAHLAIKLIPQISDYLVIAETHPHPLFSLICKKLQLNPAQNNGIEEFGGQTVSFFLHFLCSFLPK